ncbi:hypothetical protein KAR91_16140 [Candidatus Pacearchaeota archaeon]|nr:hypothetical protein [Candidatus Pacearchaeota archaeon]
MSKATKALATIRVSEKKLPDEEPYRTWTLNTRRTRMRNSLIYRHWVESESKDAELAILSERYGLAVGRIKGIIEKMKTDGAVVPHLASNVEVLRSFKRAEVLEDYNGLRSEIESQVEALRSLKNDPEGGVWVDIEETSDSGGKLGERTIVKRVKIDTEIRRLLAELAKTHPEEAKALADYGTKVADVDPAGMARVIGASAEFLEQLGRVQEMSKNKPIDVEVEIID